MRRSRRATIPALLPAKLTINAKRLDFGDLFLPEHSPLGKYIAPEAFTAIAAQLATDELRVFVEFAYLCGTRKGQLARTTIAHLDTVHARAAGPDGDSRTTPAGSRFGIGWRGAIGRGRA